MDHAFDFLLTPLYSVVEPESFTTKAASLCGSYAVWDELKADLDLNIAQHPRPTAVILDEAIAYTTVYEVNFLVDDDRREVVYKEITK
jgi:hypothetical protein